MITVKEYIAEWEADKEAIIQDIMRIEKLDRTAAEKRYKVMLGTCIEAGVAIGDIIYPD